MWLDLVRALDGADLCPRAVVAVGTQFHPAPVVAAAVHVAVRVSAQRLLGQERHRRPA